MNKHSIFKARRLVRSLPNSFAGAAAAAAPAAAAASPPAGPLAAAHAPVAPPAVPASAPKTSEGSYLQMELEYTVCWIRHRSRATRLKKKCRHNCHCLPCRSALDRLVLVLRCKLVLLIAIRYWNVGLRA